MSSALSLKASLKNIFFSIFEKFAPCPGNNNKPIAHSQIRKILVAEGGGIGDLIRVFPAIECLKNNFPAASISVLASPEAKEILSLFSKNDIISEVIDYDLKSRHKGFFRKFPLIFSLRKRHFGLVYAPDRGEGMREEVLMNFLTGVPHRIGFQKGRAGSLNTITIELREDIPIVKQNLDILRNAGLQVTKEEIDLSIPEKDIHEAKLLIKQLTREIPSPVITVHPGASWKAGYRCWPLEKYISLIQRLIKELQLKIIIIGNRGDIETGKRILKEVESPDIISVMGRTTLAQMVAIIKVSSLFLGNDSGPLHIALALKIPSVAIFGSTSPEQVIGPQEGCIVIRKNLACSPCYVHQHDYTPDCKDFPCLSEISVDEVFNAVKKVLSTIFTKIPG
ncbi:MAG: glycosyltransferase family 9 protein [Candidatus Brocadia sp.]|nr:glycosyltransferase family 9 protein [Candidatus Brocadia sp.]